MGQITAGSAQTDITPADSQFLYGYPHVKRYSTGVHDPLMSSALYLADNDSGSEIMFIANDIIYVSKKSAEKIRSQVSANTGIKPESIMVTATHTHSGPKTVDTPGSEGDPAVPKADAKYVSFMEEQITKAAVCAHANAGPARLGLACANADGIGTNRRDPSGPSDPETPVLMVKSRSGENIACMLVCSMHPTVLHEDSTLVSGDFPGMSRLYLQEKVLGKECPVLHHTGPAGNQSPRHVTKANTFEEAARIGQILGKAVENTLNRMDFVDTAELASDRSFISNPPRRSFPTVKQAEKKLNRAVERLEALRAAGAPRQEVRTAECDWFGAEKTLILARAAAEGRTEKAAQQCLPAEIQVLKAGRWNFVGWPGEVFVEYALEVKKQLPETYVISLANGQMHGYTVTEDAHKEGGYEASTAMFGWETGKLFVEKTLELAEKA